LKKHLEVPVVIFPGSPSQIDSEADGILLLSLISGRNADLLIGRHVEAAPALKRSGLEVLPTGYLLVDGGSPTTASYVSGTLPIPRNKPEIASATAMAGEMLGLRLMYLDGGSGASGVVPPDVIGAVTESVEVPIFVGGGIRSADDIDTAHDAGADVVVVGTAFEASPEQWVAEMVARTGVSR
jgi:geranylgeranylglyceryl phosphate synthase family protein